jgi:hypothetical protein
MRTRLDVLEAVLGYEPEAPAILIDAKQRQVRMIQIKRSAIPGVLLAGEERLTMAHYRQTQLDGGDVMFHLMATAYWCGCLQPEHSYFFKIGEVPEPHSWRALITSSVNSNFIDLHKFRRMVQFIDEPTARALTDAALEKAENMTAALTGRAVPRWRPWET